MPLIQLLRRACHPLACALVAATALAAPAAHAQADPPGRVGRVAEVQGGVSWYEHEQGQWSAAQRNLPLTAGDRIGTAPEGRAELRIGSTTLRLGGASELEVLRLDDGGIGVELYNGSLALRIRSREVADEIELVTAEARLLPLRAGLYRLDRVDGATQAGSWRGDLRVDDPAGFVIATGQRFELFREPRSGALRFGLGALPPDAFTDWVLREEQRDERSAAATYISPEMTGAEDLDRYGRWEQHPEFGAVWLPLDVPPGWAPYRYGRWVWVRPWGWTWVDDSPWGFAPFHYGRWVFWRGGWGWVPGAYVARPVYAPALVAWVGGAGWGVSIAGGAAAVGWVPLAPREVYAPQYAATPAYRERVNPAPPYRWQHAPGQAPAGPMVYGNQGVPGALTVVPRDALLQHRPVPRAMLDGRDRPAVHPQVPLPTVAPPLPVPSPARPGAGEARPGRPIEAAQPWGPSEAPRRAAPGEGRAADRRDDRSPPARVPPAVTAPPAMPAPANATPVTPVPVAPVPPPRAAVPAEPTARWDRGGAPQPGRPADPGGERRRDRPAPAPDVAAPLTSSPQAPGRGAAPPAPPMPAVAPQAPGRGAAPPAPPTPAVAPPAPPTPAVAPQAPGRVAAPPAPPMPAVAPQTAPAPAAPAAPAPPAAPQAPKAPGGEKDRPRDGERRHAPETAPGPRDRERERAVQN